MLKNIQNNIGKKHILANTYLFYILKYIIIFPHKEVETH